MIIAGATPAVHAQLVVLNEVSRQWKWYAALISLGLLFLIYLAVRVVSGSWNPLKVIEGADGKPSTSKFQWYAWLILVLFTYLFLWILRAREGRYGAISEVPANLLGVLGFSTITAVAAKGITVSYLNNGSTSKPDPDNANSGLLTDDSGTPELAKIQMIGFTIIAIGIYAVDVLHQARGGHPTANLPNIDSSLLVLMGISQGGYLGKKLVSITTPVIDTITPNQVALGGAVTMTGSSFGGGGGSSRLLLDGAPIATVTWTDKEIQFNVPDVYPKAGGAWAPPQVVKLGVDLGGGTKGNEVLLTVLPAA